MTSTPPFEGNLESAFRGSWYCSTLSKTDKKSATHKIFPPHKSWDKYPSGGLKPADGNKRPVFTISVGMKQSKRQDRCEDWLMSLFFIYELTYLQKKKRLF